VRKQAEEAFRNFDSLTEVALSPNGRFIAFVARGLENEKEQESSSLFLVGLDELGHVVEPPRKLTHGLLQVSAPAWAPDSQRIFFLANQTEEQPQIWFTDLAGNGKQQLTAMTYGVNEFACSPDGQWLTLTALVMPQLVDDVETGHDESLFEQFAQLFVMPAFGVSAQEGQQWPQRLTDGVVDYTQPSWTPDSQEIGVLCNAAEEGERSFLTDLWALAPGTGEARCLTDHSLEIDSYAWSPDGRSAIVVAGHAEENGNVQQLYLVTRRGNVGDNILPLTPEMDNVTLSQALSTPNTPGLYRPAWSQDGQKVYFLVTEQQEVNVYSLEVVWRTLVRLTERSLTCFLALFPGSHALLVAQQYPAQNWNLYRLPLDVIGDREVEQLTNF
jgi:Tol biopolymer transport system component